MTAADVRIVDFPKKRALLAGRAIVKDGKHVPLENARVCYIHNVPNESNHSNLIHTNLEQSDSALSANLRILQTSES